MNSEGNPKQPATVRVKPMRLVQFSDKIGGGIPRWGSRRYARQMVYQAAASLSQVHQPYTHTTEVGGFRLPKKEV